MAIENQVYPGKDSVIQAVQLKTANSMLGQLVQHLDPLKLECNLMTPKGNPGLNQEVPGFQIKRDSAAARF